MPGPRRGGVAGDPLPSPSSCHGTRASPRRNHRVTVADGRPSPPRRGRVTHAVPQRGTVPGSRHFRGGPVPTVVVLALTLALAPAPSPSATSGPVGDLLGGV